MAEHRAVMTDNWYETDVYLKLDMEGEAWVKISYKMACRNRKQAKPT